ncbi:MAG: ATP-binding protein [Dehalococcoidia bacterium]|nr:ATP-binding protein [Dehalococcoidia bacterium]
MNTLRQRLKRLIERQTLAATIILIFLLVFIPMAVMVSWYSTSETHKSLRKASESNLENLSSQVGAEVERVLIRSYQDMETLAKNPIIRSDTASAEDKLAEITTVNDIINKRFTDIALVDPDGNMIISSDQDYQGDWSGQDWFREAVAGNISVSPPHGVLNTPKLAMEYAAPVKDVLQNVTAVIVAQMEMNTIWAITETATLGETGWTSIVDESYTFITIPNPDHGELTAQFTYARKNIRTTQYPGSIELFEYKNNEGDKVLAAKATLDISPYLGEHVWHIITSQTTDEAFAPMRDALRKGLIGIAGGFILFLIVSALLIQRTTKPFHILSIGAEQVGSGDFTYRAPVSGTREVRRLAISFNTMVRNLQMSESLRAEHGLLRKLQAAGTALASALSAEEILRIAANSIREILASDLVWILMADEDGNSLEARVFVSPKKGQGPEDDDQGLTNSLSHRKIELTKDGGLLEKVLRERETLFLDDLTIFKDLAKGDPLLETVITELGMAGINLLPLALPDREFGVMVFGRTSGKALSDSEKRIVLVFAHQVTISLERARLGAVEMKNVAELARLSHLKSRILYILSHELKTPLTSLRSSSRLLQESDINALNFETQQRLIGNIVRATARLVGVADDIYPIAEVLTGEMQIVRGKADCRKLVNEAVESVSPLTARKTQSVNISIDPSVSSMWADKYRIKQVLVNLLTNAGNFSPPRSPIDIVISDETAEVIFEVRDQGIGISEEDQTLIFDGFYQADSETVRRAGGKGLGLLFAKTVVELHGGRIWVKSKLGEGSSFYFSVPKQV